MEITLKPKRAIPKDDTEILELLVKFQLSLSCTQEKVDFIYDELYRFRESIGTIEDMKLRLQKIAADWRLQVSEITKEDLDSPTPLSVMTMAQLNKLKLTLALGNETKVSELFYGQSN